MTSGGINNLITVGNTIFCSGWFTNDTTNASYTIDSAIFPASSQTQRFVPFFIKLDSSLNVTWAGSIIPSGPNSYGSACVADSQGNIYASVKVEGAGDTFAGGFIGYLAKTNDISFNNMKNAIICGSAMASFCVEKFGTERIMDLTDEELNKRIAAFSSLIKFDIATM
jgi:hypothetical protein